MTFLEKFASEKEVEIKEDARIKANVIKKIIQLKNEGIDLLKGTFCGDNGNVQLDITSRCDDKYSICYACYGKMWIWIIEKSEIYAEGGAPE